MSNITFDQIRGQLDVITSAISRTDRLVARGRAQHAELLRQSEGLRGRLEETSEHLEKREHALLQCRSEVERLEAEIARLREKLGEGGESEGAAAFTLWMWDEPIAALADKPDVVRMVRPMLARTPDPVDAARVTSQRARDAEAEGQRIAVMPQGFGGEAGFADGFDKYGSGIHRHPADALGDAAQLATSRFTPWIRNGVHAVTEWMNAFVDAWDGPDPEAFHFDAEPGFWPRPWADAYDLSSNGDAYLDGFKAIMEDPRWSTEPLFSTGRTMAEEYERAGRPTFVPDINPYNRANDDWRPWIVQLLWDEFACGMFRAGYAPVLQRWPDCLVGNYGEHRASGFSRASYDSPVLYGSPEKERSELEAVRDAAAAGDRLPIIPWIKLPHVGTSKSYSVEAVRGNIELAYEFGVRRFIVWWDHREPSIAENEANFNALAGIFAELAARREPAVV